MEEQTWQQLILPKPVELLIYLACSVIILAGINIEVIVNLVSGEMVFKNIASNDYFGIFSGLARFPAINTVVIVVFWGGVGLVAYTIVWALINALIEIRNDIVVETEYANKGPFWTRVKPPLLKAGLLITLLIWLALNRYVVGIFLLRTFHNTLSSQAGMHIWQFPIPILLGAVDILLAVTLFKSAFQADDIVDSLDQAKSVKS